MDDYQHKIATVYVNGLSVCLRQYPGEYDIENRRGWVERKVRQENSTTIDDILSAVSISTSPSSIEQFKPRAPTTLVKSVTLNNIKNKVKH